MKKNFFLLAILVLTSGCASLHTKAYDEITVGNPKQHVIDAFGKPNDFKTIPGSNKAIWIYRDGADTCEFQIDESQQVSDYDCNTDPTYVSKGRRAAAAFFGGLSQGYNNHSQQPAYQPPQYHDQPAPIHCDTQVNNFIGTANTNCY